MKSNGIDISSHNGNINWESLSKTDTDFVIIRCGIGGNIDDPKIDNKFVQNIENAIKHNFDIGIYLYSYAKSIERVIIEAETTLKWVEKYKPNINYPIFFDVEDKSQISLGKQLLTDMTRVFCSIVGAAGYKTGVYSFKSFLQNNLYLSALEGKYDIWMAHFVNDPVSPSMPCDIWQYTEKGSVGGVTGNVDRNYCYKNYADKPEVPEGLPELKKGSTGESVKKLQKLLWDIGFYFGSFDGSFGANTERYVNRFLKTYDMKQNGIVTNEVWEKLYHIYNNLSDDIISDGIKDEFSDKERHMKISKHYRVGQLWLNLRTPTLKIAPELMDAIEMFVQHFKKPLKFITENSIYCLKSEQTHSPNSYHYTGEAIDFYIDGCTPLELAQFAEKNPNIRGIGIYRGWDHKNQESEKPPVARHIHMDVRKSMYRYWDMKANGNLVKSAGFGGVVYNFKQGEVSPAIILIQRELNNHGYNCGNPDGSFGNNTKTQLSEFQADNNVTNDGVYGIGTNKYLKVFDW